MDGNEATNDYALLTAAFYGASDINAWPVDAGMGIQDKMYNAHGGTPVGGSAALISTLQNPPIRIIPDRGTASVKS